MKLVALDKQRHEMKSVRWLISKEHNAYQVPHGAEKPLEITDYGDSAFNRNGEHVHRLGAFCALSPQFLAGFGECYRVNNIRRFASSEFVQGIR